MTSARLPRPGGRQRRSVAEDAERGKALVQLRKRLPEWVAGEVQPVVAEALAGGSLAAAIRVEDDKLFIDYQATTAGSGYVAPIVMLEFGARSTGEPASFRDVVCDAAGLVDGWTSRWPGRG